MRNLAMSICLSFWFFSVFAASNPADDADKPAPGLAENTANPLILDEKRQQLAGIKTAKLTAATNSPEITAYGSVLSLAPLLQLRQQYLAAQAQQQSATAKYTETQLNLARTEHLHQQDIVSTRRLQEQQALSQSDKAMLTAVSYQQNSILASSRLEWGNALTTLFLANSLEANQPFLNNTAQLIQVSLPNGAPTNANLTTIFVDEHGQRHTASPAELISVSPRVDPVNHSASYFYKSTTRNLPVGIRLTAWIATDQHALHGVNIPKSALVWHLGQAFVFVKTTAQQFTKLALPTYVNEENHYFVSENLQAGDELVITGAQTLLSQQLKPQIPDEDDD